VIEVKIAGNAIDKLLPPLSDYPDCGGYVEFAGVVRNVNEGKIVRQLHYEAYTTLAVSEMQRICEEATTQFNCRFIRAIHREGTLEIGDTAVIIQVLAGHRQGAFSACRYVIDEIKRRVPIWKKEFYEDGTSSWTVCHHTH
jgi:molybdopterin synthase catalytic subunit